MLLNHSVGEDLSVHWTASISNQPILRKSIEGLMLKLQYFGHLMQRTDSFEKTLMLGRIEGGRRRGLQRMRWLNGITDWWTWIWARSGSWWWTGKPGLLQSMWSQRARHSWATELIWTEEIVSFLGMSNFSDIGLSQLFNNNFSPLIMKLEKLTWSNIPY